MGVGGEASEVVDDHLNGAVEDGHGFGEDLLADAPDGEIISVRHVGHRNVLVDAQAKLHRGAEGAGSWRQWRVGGLWCRHLVGVVARKKSATQTPRQQEEEKKLSRIARCHIVPVTLLMFLSHDVLDVAVFARLLVLRRRGGATLASYAD